MTIAWLIGICLIVAVGWFSGAVMAHTFYEVDDVGDEPEASATDTAPEASSLGHAPPSGDGGYHPISQETQEDRA